MGENKEQNKTPKDKNENTYKDSFLGREITLSPNAYQVYLSRETNALALTQEVDSDEFETENIPKKRDKYPAFLTATKSLERESEDEDMQKFQEAIKSLSPESRKSIINEIINKVKDEKEGFDFKIKEVNLDKNKIEKPETESVKLFGEMDEKIYTTKFSKEKMSTEIDKDKGFFATIAAIFASDVVWSSIAGALILAVFLFYFQGIQPLILNNYGDNAKNQVTTLASKYNDQVKNYFTSQNKLSAQLEFRQNELCKDTLPYGKATEDSENLNLLKAQLLRDSKLSEVPPYRNFYDQQIKDEYTKLFKEYTANLNTYQLLVKDLQQIPRFLEYQNSWIKTCAVIQSTPNNFANIKASCQDLIKDNNTYQAEELASFWTDIKTQVDSGISLCTGVAANNLGNFQKQWFIEYGKISTYSIDFSETNDKAGEINKKFILETVKNSQIKIQDILDKKSTLNGMWYLIKLQS